MDFPTLLERAGSVQEVFAVAKAAVAATAQRKRDGLLVGFSELGIQPWGLVGAYHPVGSDLIVLNSTLLRRIAASAPQAFKPYAFNLLLHEYLHTLGVMDEPTTRTLSEQIALATFGERHPVTAVASEFLQGGPHVQSRVEHVMPLDAPIEREWLQ